MKRKILIIIIIFIISIIGYFIIKNKKAEKIENNAILKTEETINENKYILKIVFDQGDTIGTYFFSQYCISEDKEKVIIETEGFSETTGKATNNIQTVKINKKKIEEFIKELEENINKNAFELKYIETQFGEMPDIKYPLYRIEYNKEKVYVQENLEFYKSIEEFLKTINNKK